MKDIIRLPVCAVVAAALVHCGDASIESVASSEVVARRIERIERGLPQAIAISGQGPRTTTIFELMERYRVPAVSVAVINDGRIEWAKGYGVIEEGGPAVDSATLFFAGQIGQGIAAMGALRLVQDGHIDLDENVNGKLTSWRIPESEFTRGEAVTLRRILSHSSGLSLTYLPGYQDGELIPNLQQVLDGEAPAKNAPVRVEAIPGSRTRYSAGGYVILQQLLNDLLARPYDEFIRATVLLPLGMRRSFHAQPLPDNLAANAASGHEQSGAVVTGRWRIFPDLAANGLWATPSDLARFIIELQQSFAGESNKILSQGMVEQVLLEHGEGRGLAFELGGQGLWRSFRLEGHGNNYLSELFGYVTQGKGAVVMTNSANGEAVKLLVLRAIAAEYGWPDFRPLEVEVVELSDDVLNELFGRYSHQGGEPWLLKREGERILLERGGEARAVRELVPLSDNLFIEAVFGLQYEVERTADRSVTGLTVIMDGRRLFTLDKID